MGVLDHPNVKALFAYVLCNTISSNIWNGQVFPAFVYLISNGSNTAVGMLSGIMGISQLCVAPCAGYLIDKYDRIKILHRIAIVGLLNMCYLLLVIWNNWGYEPLFAAVCCMGIYSAFLGPSMDSVLADSTEPGQRATVYAYQVTLRQMGSIAGPVVTISLFYYIGNSWEASICRIVILCGLSLNICAMCILFRLKSSNYNISESVEDDHTIRVYGKLNQSDADFEANNNDSNNHHNDIDDDNLLDDNIDDGDDDSNIQISVNSNNNSGSGSNSDISNSTVNEDNENGKIEQIQAQEELELVNDMFWSPFIGLGYEFEISYVASMICIADVITGLASGMSVKFFPIFFITVLNMQPVTLAILFMITPSCTSFMIMLNTRYISKILGRIWTPVLMRMIGTTLLLTISFLITVRPDSYLTILFLFVIRTACNNSTKPLTKSIINDVVPTEQRGRWNSLEMVNAATWSGSACLGGYLIDNYGFVPNFVATACLQLSATIPLVIISSQIPSPLTKYIARKMNEYGYSYGNYNKSNGDNGTYLKVSGIDEDEETGNELTRMMSDKNNNENGNIQV